KPTLRGLQTRAVTAHCSSHQNLCSRRRPRSIAPNNHRNRQSELHTTVANRHVSEGKTRKVIEKATRLSSARCTSYKPSLSCGKAKTMAPHSERSVRVRRLIASPRKA